MEPLTIGKLAKRAKVHIETIRYYERRGLIPRPPRPDSGYRTYSPEMVKRLEFIKRAKALGFSLKEIHELLRLRLDPNTPCAEIKSRAEAKIGHVEEKIRSLRRMKEALVQLTNACRGQGLVSECPILEALEK